MNPAAATGTLTATLLLLSLTSHIAVGRVRYLKSLAEKQAIEAQKAWANGERRSSQSAYTAATEKQEDYKLIEVWVARVRAVLFITSGVLALLTLALYMT